MNAKTPPDHRPGIWQVLSPYWQSSEKFLAFAMLAVMIGINLGSAWINVEANRVAEPLPMR